MEMNKKHLLVHYIEGIVSELYEIDSNHYAKVINDLCKLFKVEVIKLNHNLPSRDVVIRFNRNHQHITDNDLKLIINLCDAAYQSLEDVFYDETVTKVMKEGMNMTLVELRKWQCALMLDVSQYMRVCQLILTCRGHIY